MVPSTYWVRSDIHLFEHYAALFGCHDDIVYVVHFGLGNKKKTFR